MALGAMCNDSLERIKGSDKSWEHFVSAILASTTPSIPAPLAGYIPYIEDM